jgi:hypothetical protein
MKKALFGFLMMGLIFAALNVATAESLQTDHPCYDIDPSNGGRDGHPCWPKGTDPSVSVEPAGDTGDSGAGALLGGGQSNAATVGEVSPTETPKSGGIAGWIKGGLKSLGIGTGAGDMPPMGEGGGGKVSVCQASEDICKGASFACGVYSESTKKCFEKYIRESK